MAETWTLEIRKLTDLALAAPAHPVCVTKSPLRFGPRVVSAMRGNDSGIAALMYDGGNKDGR
ncbi:hypothetical protein [Rhodopseudomonas palustris]|uniref:hypothetical protein n=1 Tax=Rhodopseudomonas palustris TaxID=1076 RepID=UPI0010579C1B|nr:hypothetical protein [Rhodopseudomonas palustris]